MAKQIKDENGNVYVQKKRFYKRWWFWLLVVLVVVFLGSGAFGGSSDSDSSSDSAAKSQTSSKKKAEANPLSKVYSCLLYTSDAADDSLRVDLGGRRIIKKKK